MKIERIDHLNLTVADIDRSVAFYRRVLGMKAESMGEGRAALYFGQQKIHLDAAGGGMTMGSEKRMPARVFFVTETPIAEVTDPYSKAAPSRCVCKDRVLEQSAQFNRSISTTRTRTRSKFPAIEPADPSILARICQRGGA